MKSERILDTKRIVYFSLLLLVVLLSAACGGEQASTDGRTGTISGSGK